MKGQTSSLIGKYCLSEDKNWHCIEFFSDNTSKNTSNIIHHPLRNSNEHWEMSGDTIVFTKTDKKGSIKHYGYIFQSDTLYTLRYNKKLKRLERNIPMMKKP